MEKNPQQVRLNKALAEAGVASRRKCDEIIFDGKVKINGETVLEPGRLVGERDHIQVFGKKVNPFQKKLIFMFNKPKGYVCTANPLPTQKSVLSFFAHIKKRFFTVGRLDKDTSGLLLVTTDGDLAQKIIHPSSNIQKEYLAKTDKEITPDHLQEISKGVVIDRVLIKPVKVQKVRRGTVKVSVKEGKNREVRLLLEKAGLEVLELKRIRIGGLHLGHLAEGAFKELSNNEIETLFS
ncbi:pseudouridine synthase [Criblamydia sequanensis]|uniref:Pseudouridine synthase n=1 Tax=Candidatus Criblamydia sequanensis CRIB-18 TaxID=1437425 RepID=A0A090D2T3_9BACT|nr:pseudouridine synthase [Criblamydia sequanensis]CDR34628.1 Pseudouridine synthase [Criblamydia sequanensis CRIB-18]